MRLNTISDYLWGKRAKLSYLMIASAILLLTCLGARDIWTQEHRWADIVWGMFYRHDFLHPYLGETRYYDKPLLSYWMIAFLAKLFGGLTTWALRLPSALAGMLGVWSIYRLGIEIKNKQLGFMAGWLLLTTFYFVFWARTSSADMLNLGGSLFAIAWYYGRRKSTEFFDYAVFFMIVALTSLCKGLIGAVIPMLAVMVDLTISKTWKKHLRLSIVLAVIPAAIVYFLPFWASSYFNGQAYGESGLYLVYRENILRYVQPFDHQGPIYTYFIYLPIYLLPWTIFFIPALFTLNKQWKKMTVNAKWLAWTLFAVFMFLTLSGSRRSYYVLPMVPFAILFTAEWLASVEVPVLKRKLIAGLLVVITYLFLFAAIDVGQSWYYSRFGVTRFAEAVMQEAGKTREWSKWNVVMLDAESKLRFYLQLPPHVKTFGITGQRDEQTSETLAASWPMIVKKPADTIFVTRAIYVDALKKYLSNYEIVRIDDRTNIPFVRQTNITTPVAFIPKK